MRQSRRIAVAVVAAVALLTAGCSRSKPKEAETEPPVLVIAEPVRLGNIRGVVSATGVVQTLPGAEVPLIAPQAGRIAAISKNVGDPVKSGEVLVRFEFPSLGPEVAARAAAVRAADLRARNARLVQERVRSLLARGAASQKEMDDADRDVAEAEAELGEARASQVLTEAKGRYTTIHAPFTGVVSARLHDPSDLVSPEENDPILRIIDPRQVQLVATVPVEALTRFTVGAAARAMAEGKPRPELLRVASRPAPEKGATTVAVNLAFESPTELAPGTQVGVEIDAEQRTNVPLVPAIAVLKDANANPYVMIAAGNVAARRPVAVGLVDTEHIEIRSGVRAGELIITLGHTDLRDGTPISVSPP
jgi:RND family efflux transporter MFP subunit